jgi:hypothetical protein
MSHCSGDRVSVSVAGAFGGLSGGPPAAAPVWPSSSCVTYGAVGAAFSTELSTLSRSLRNESFDDDATATPIWS